MASKFEAGREGHLELVLQQIGALPTLPPIAVRVMSLAESGDADLREIASVIESDPALSAKVLALCRRADLGISKSITSVDRAVVMLGLDAVRAAVLSVEVHSVFAGAIERVEPRDRRVREPASSGYDREGLWKHCLAVACASEIIAAANAAALRPYSPGEAFLAGLLHDLGKVALDAVLPRTYAKVVDLAASRQSNIAEIERKVIGLDHHLAGKRLAERWGLPHALQDVMWLHGQPASNLPDVRHGTLIGAVTVADAMARELHLGWSGNYTPCEDITSMCESFGLSVRALDGWQFKLHQRFQERCADLGLNIRHDESELLGCIARANTRLGRLGAMLDERARESERGNHALALIEEFHARDVTGRDAGDVIGAVATSVVRTFGRASYALLLQTRGDAPWSLHKIDPDGSITAKAMLTPPAGLSGLAELACDAPMESHRAQAMQWLVKESAPHLRTENLRILPLISGNGPVAVLLHDRAAPDLELTKVGLAALASTWGRAIASSLRHDGARRLGEQLAEANRRLAETQARLVEAQTMSRLGEVSSGVAHEMNNPLTVISGQSQLLAQCVADVEVRTMARSIVEASEKLSDLIQSLHLFSRDPAVNRREVDLPAQIAACRNEALQRITKRPAKDAAVPDSDAPIRIFPEHTPRMVRIDEAQFRLALTEVMVNALQSGPKSKVEVRVHIDPLDDRLIVSVKDDGRGMSAHALRHACDPFYSDQPAGRRTGLGLTRARRAVELHGGELKLESEPGKGTCVRIVLPDWRTAVGGTTSEAA